MVYAFAYSIKYEQNKRIFIDKKNILILSTKRNKLCIGTKLLFYNPLPISALVGEAIITELYLDFAENILTIFNETILQKDDLEKYIIKSPIKYSTRKERSNKKFTIIKFDSIIKYPKPLKLSKIMNPTGIYIDYTEYCNLHSK